MASNPTRPVANYDPNDAKREVTYDAQGHAIPTPRQDNDPTQADITDPVRHSGEVASVGSERQAESRPSRPAVPIGKTYPDRSPYAGTPNPLSASENTYPSPYPSGALRQATRDSAPPSKATSELGSAVHYVGSIPSATRPKWTPCKAALVVADWTDGRVDLFILPTENTDDRHQVRNGVEYASDYGANSWHDSAECRNQSPS